MLVVLYGCAPSESSTIKSLLKSEVCLESLLLVVWNNGPTPYEIDQDLLLVMAEKKLSLVFVQTPFNAPLSWVYNYFLENFVSDINIISDHDSVFSKEYLESAFFPTSFFLRLPIIYTKGVARNPTVKGEFSDGPYNNKTKVISIGSGLVLSKTAVDIIASVYGSVFDEKFALYGVDTSFFYRIHKANLGYMLETIPGFEHSLSRLESESKEIKKIRLVERSYDFALMFRNYPEIWQIKYLVKQLILLMLNKNILDFKSFFRALLSGIHPRASEKFRLAFDSVTKNCKDSFFVNLLIK